MVLGDPVTALLLVEAVALLAILFGRPVRDHVSRRGVPALRA
jgi:hypothetical protein